MKYLFISSTLIVFLLSISNLTFGQRRTYPASKKLINVPTFPHQQAVKVFYLNEKPDSAYVKVALLEVARTAEHSYASIIQDLQVQAQNEGVDAIIIFQMYSGQRSYQNSEGYTNFYAIKEVLAYGIKYRSSFDYLSQIPKTEAIYLYNDSTQSFDKEYYRTFDMLGKVIDYNCSNSLNDFLYTYSLYHLVEEEDNWRYSDKNNLITTRYFNDRTNQKKCIFQYDSLQRLNQITIQTEIIVRSNTITNSQEIQLFYNENGQLHQRDIYKIPMDKKSFYREIFRYDELGRIKEKLTFQYVNGKRMPLAKCFYTDFYSFEDLEK